VYLGGVSPATAAPERTDSLLLVRLGAEVTLKSRRTRRHFLERLESNLLDAIEASGASGRIDSVWGRTYVRTSMRAVPAVSRVFGISSLSPVGRVVHADLDTIVQAGVEVFADSVRDRHFAVRARRTGKHDFNSRDIAMRLGAALQPLSAGVRLTDPDVEAHVEVRNQSAYLFSERINAMGGLPLGVEGHATALLSGGFDSAVAAWLLMKRGVALDYVFCNLGGDAYERAVLHVAKVLADDWSYGTRPRLHIVDFGPPLDELRAKVRPSYWQVVLKRLMYRAASRIGTRYASSAIVTGEAIGQVSSQTLANLRAIESASTLPVFRPLLGFDKEEIIARARTIGTAALSEQVREYCAIAPGRPVTAALPQRVEAEDALMDPSLLDHAIEHRRTVDLRSLSATDLVEPYLFTTDIPADALVLDCRPVEHYRAWHLPGSIHRDEWDLLRGLQSLDRNRTYVLYCAHGIQTAYLAEKMQRLGIEAHSFRGGMRGVLQYARDRGLPVP
jgi:tRNA uracil 4-sulfurtransferase